MIRQFRPRLSPEEDQLIQDYRSGLIIHTENKVYDEETGDFVWQQGRAVWRKTPKDKRILVVGDLHAPFVRRGYFEHCVAVFKKYNCNHVVFIGDIIDNHYSSFHDTDPDGMGASDELDAAINELAKWHTAFPDADVVLGNHDMIVLRKVFRDGVSKRWIRRFADVLKTPTWNFVQSIEYDGVKYVHGLTGGAVNGAMTKALSRGKSIVQGHWHTKSWVRWHVSDVDRIFAMQVGCGVDEDAYAMAYNKDPMERWMISCGVVLENGKLPIVEPMRL